MRHPEMTGGRGDAYSGAQVADRLPVKKRARLRLFNKILETAPQGHGGAEGVAGSWV